MFKIDLSNRAKKFLAKLIPKHFAQIDKKIIELSNNPKPNDFIQLRGLKGVYRVTVGEYRIIYRIENNCLFIQDIGKRNDNDVYKKVK